MLEQVKGKKEGKGKKSLFNIAKDEKKLNRR